ncbi:MAG: hypothetical protein ACK5TK_12635 [Betaproteobacteria bacterium]
MSPDRTAADIQRLGFRRWYERQLIESHAYLVTAFLALVLLLAGFEALDAVRGHPTYWLLLILVSAGAGLVTYVGWRRFTALLARAEAFAGGAECPNCKAWGKFVVTGMESTAADDPPESGRPHWLRVRCRKCEADWRLG